MISMQKQKAMTAVREACKGKSGDEKVECGFEVLASKIDQNTSAIKEVDKHVSRVDEDVKVLRQDVVEIKEWQEKADTRFGNIDASIARLDNKIDDVETHMVGRFDGVHEHIERMSGAIVDALGSRDKKRFVKKQREIGEKQERSRKSE